MREIWVIAENTPWLAVLITGAKALCADVKITAFIQGGEDAAKKAVTITNSSPVEPLVLIKGFGPNHPDAPQSA